MVAATQMHAGEVGSAIIDIMSWRGERESAPLVRPIAQALADPYLSEIIERYGDDEAHTLGQGTGRNFVFHPASGEGLLHFNVQGGLALFLVYCGPESRYLSTVTSALSFAEKQGWTPALLAREDRVPGLEAVGLTSTCICAWQDLASLDTFTLEGGAMRRLRYCYTRYAALQGAMVAEYRLGTSPAIDERIHEIAEAWIKGKGTVPAYLRELCEGFGTRPLGRSHRVFLTSAQGRIDNVIVISSAGVRRGYVLDLELYDPESPFGHLEFAIAQIAMQLQSEGWGHFSLGLTMGIDVEQPRNFDPTVRRDLERLRRIGVFNGDGNFQFKNKFRPVIHNGHLCGLRGKSPSLIKLVRMLADPYRSDDAERISNALRSTESSRPTLAGLTPHGPKAA
jgi:lysylphosphatidylglycerol synthetase-like protein (DUF2156 family)